MAQLSSALSHSSTCSLKENCKYLLITATNLFQSREISSVQYDLLKELVFSYDADLYSTQHTSAHIQQYILRYTKKIYELLFQNLTLEHAHILATTYADEVADNLTIDTRALVYGEIEFDSFVEVLAVATDGLQRFQKFIDLGHGIGRAIIVVRYIPSLINLKFLRLHCLFFFFNRLL